MFAVALGQSVFLWDAQDGNITQLMELSLQGEYFSSLAWMQEGRVLGVGINTGVVQVCSLSDQMCC